MTYCRWQHLQTIEYRAVGDMASQWSKCALPDGLQAVYAAESIVCTFGTKTIVGVLVAGADAEGENTFWVLDAVRGNWTPLEAKLKHKR